MARSRTICLLLALVTVLAYSPVRHAGLVVFDDPVYVQNSHVEAGLTWGGFKWAFTTWYGSNWHPLTWLSHMLDVSLFGQDAGAQHFVNVLFHAANAILLFLLLFRLTEKLWSAAFVGALFAWHPLHVESVAWISERKDVLSTFFGLLTLLAYVKCFNKSTRLGEASSRQETQNPSTFPKAAADRQSKVWYGAALGLFALSLMAKPMLVTLPFVLLLLDFWPLRRVNAFGFVAIDSESRATKPGTRNANLSRLILEKLPFLALTIASCIVTFLAQRGEAVVSLEQRPFGLRFANALISYVEYLSKALWPSNLAVIYPLPTEIPVWQIISAAVVLALISFLVWRARRTGPYLFVGWLWFLGTLVPVIGIIQVGGQALADRYTYVPLIGVFIAAAYGAADVVARFRISSAIVAFIAAGVVAANLCVTEYQLRFWQNSQMLFGHAIAVTKENAIAHINLGVALEQEERRPEALAEYRKAIDIDPRRFQAHNNLANLLSTMGWREEAFKEYQEALRLNAEAPVAHLNFATLLAEMGRFNEAVAEYAKAAQLAPEDPRPFYLMGKASLRHGQSGEAVKYFREALQRAPRDYETLTWLARVLAADQNPAIRNASEAVSLAEQATRLTRGEQPFVLDTLGMAYAEAGRFKDAQSAVQRAIQLAAAAGAQKTVPEMQRHLQFYEAEQPYREDFSKAPAISK